MTLLEFFRLYTMPKSLGAEAKCRSRRIVVIPQPYLSADPVSDKYDQYCHLSRTQHKYFRQMVNLLYGYNNYINAHAAFLQSGHFFLPWKMARIAFFNFHRARRITVRRRRWSTSMINTWYIHCLPWLRMHLITINRTPHTNISQGSQADITGLIVGVLC